MSSVLPSLRHASVFDVTNQLERVLSSANASSGCPPRVSSVKLILTSAHLDLVDAVLKSHGVTDAIIERAVKHYLRTAQNHFSNMVGMPEFPLIRHLPNDAPSEQVSIFADVRRVAVGVPERVASKLQCNVQVMDVTKRGTYQTGTWAQNAQGYVAFPHGIDFNGPYDFNPAGALVDLRVEPTNSIDSNKSSEWALDLERLEISTVSRDASTRPKLEPALNALDADDDTNRQRQLHECFLYAQAFALVVFCQRNDAMARNDTAALRSIRLLPTAEIDLVTNHAVVDVDTNVAPNPVNGVARRRREEAAPQVTWRQAVEFLAAECDKEGGDGKGGAAKPRSLREIVVHDLLDNSAVADLPPGTLVRGLPGFGKSIAMKQVLVLLGVVQSMDDAERHVVPLGQLVGGQYHGDVTSAFSAMMGRPHAMSSLCLLILDEMDLTATRGNDTAQEQISAWLTRFTKETKAWNLHLLCTTNNDLAIVGAIRSRFSSRIRTMPGITFQQCKNLLHRCKNSRLLDRNLHQDQENYEERLTRCAASALGLSHRALRSTGCDVRQMQRDIGNEFPGDASALTLPEIYALRHTRGQRAEHMRAFLIAACGAQPPVLTGRMSALCTRIGGHLRVFVDIEIHPQQGELVLKTTDSYKSLPTASRPLHTLRSSTHRTCRHFVLSSRDELFGVLLDVAIAANSTCLYSVTGQFMSHAIGATATSSAEDTYKRAASLLRGFCSQISTSFFVFDMSEHCAVEGGNDTEARNHRVGCRAALDFLRPGTGLFSSFDEGRGTNKSMCCVLLASVAEATVLEQVADFSFSDATRFVALPALGHSFPCAEPQCGRVGVRDSDEFGCVHMPEDGHPQLMCQVTMERREEARHPVGQLGQPSPNNSLRTQFPPSRQVAFADALMLVRRGESHSSRLNDTILCSERVVSAEVLCRNRCRVNLVQQSGNLHICPCARHLRPSLTRYVLPSDVREKHQKACKMCDATAIGVAKEQELARLCEYCCIFCGKIEVISSAW